MSRSGHDLQAFLGLQEFGGHVAAVLQGDRLAQGGQVVLALGDHQVAALPEEDLVAQLGGHVLVHGDAFLGQADVLLGGPLLADAAAAAAGRSAADVVLLQDHDVLQALLGQFVGRGQAVDAAADDHRVGGGGNRSGGQGDHGFLLRRRRRPAGTSRAASWAKVTGSAGGRMLVSRTSSGAHVRAGRPVRRRPRSGSPCPGRNRCRPRCSA